MMIVLCANGFRIATRVRKERSADGVSLARLVGRQFLDREQRLALLLSQTAALRSSRSEEIADLGRASDFGALSNILSRHGLLALAGSRLEKIAPSALPASFRETVARAVDHGRRRSLLLESAAKSVVAGLEAAGIAAVPLKGPLLARRIHGDSGLRPSSDIDVLVSRGRLDEAKGIVEAHGYAPPDDIPFVGGLPVLHYTFEALRGWPPPVELHWRIHWYETAFSERMLQRSVLDDRGVRRLDRADELAALLLFYQRDSFVALRLAADIAAWWDAYEADLPPGGLERVAAEHPELRDALSVSAAVVEKLVGVPATPLLPESRLRPRRSAWAERLADWRYGVDTKQSIANAALIDLLLTPRGAIGQYVRRYLFQPPAMFAREYGLPEGPRRRYRFRRAGHAAARAGKAAGRYAYAVWRVRGGRTWAPPTLEAAATRALSSRKNGERPDVPREWRPTSTEPSVSPSSRTSPSPASRNSTIPASRA
jgi:Uncharacterised nucleotidyltransferase